MGINTRTYILGGIVGISVLFTLTMALQTTNNVDVALLSAPQSNGHATIYLTFEDGSTKYVQTDNQMHLACLSAMHNAAFGTTGSAADQFQTLRFYQSATLPSTGATPNQELNEAELADAADITTSASTSGTGQLASYTTLFTFDTVTFGQGGTIAATDADFGKFVRQVGLVSGTAVGGTNCASFLIGGCGADECGISSVTTAKVTWTIATTDT